jgi:regulator of protease activity HflC (stomatin/prohibitin superfamily)
MEFLVGALIAIVVALLLARTLLTTVTVFEYQRGLKFVNGRFVGVVEPGRHWLRRLSDAVWTIDMRESLLSIPGQEVITSDGVSVKLTMGVRYRITDPAVAITQIEDYRAATYVLLQVGLREVIGTTTIEDVLQRRDTIGPAVQARCVEAVGALGLELVAVQIKDLMFPGPLKRVFAQVTEARQQGLAALEKARGETAALRSLSNAARLVDANPSLLQLRTLQQLASSSGNTLIVGLPQSSTPLPIRQQSEPGQLPASDEGSGEDT